MSFFDGVTVSVAGLVVLAFAVLRFQFGDILFGKRVWGKVTLAAASLIGGVAYLKPVDFTRGMNTVVAASTREVSERMAPVFASLADTFATPPKTP